MLASALFVKSFDTFSERLPHTRTSAKAALADVFDVKLLNCKDVLDFCLKYSGVLKLDAVKTLL